MDIIEMVKNLIKVESGKFEYVEKKYEPVSYDYRERETFLGSYGQLDLFKGKSYEIDSNELEIEVVWVDADGEENSGFGYGKTKAEAWFDFLCNNPEVSMSMDEDYSFQ